jgi:hypothetical protein
MQASPTTPVNSSKPLKLTAAGLVSLGQIDPIAERPLWPIDRASYVPRRCRRHCDAITRGRLQNNKCTVEYRVRVKTAPCCNRSRPSA